MDSDLILNHFKSDVADVKRKYGKTFYAYQMSVKGRATEFNTHLDAMVGNWVENVEQPKWLSVLSAKTSVDQDLLMVFYESINVPFIANLDSQNVLYILGHLLSVMKENMELMDKFFSSSINAENARKFVLSKDINIWTESGIKSSLRLLKCT